LRFPRVICVIDRLFGQQKLNTISGFFPMPNLCTRLAYFQNLLPVCRLDLVLSVILILVLVLKDAYKDQFQVLVLVLARFGPCPCLCPLYSSTASVLRVIQRRNSTAPESTKMVANHLSGLRKPSTAMTFRGVCH